MFFQKAQIQVGWGLTQRMMFILHCLFRKVIQEEKWAHPSLTNTEHEEENRRRYGKNSFLMSAVTLTFKPWVKHMDLHYSKLSTEKERQRKGGKRKRKRKESTFKERKGKEESSQDESSNGWNSFNSDRK